LGANLQPELGLGQFRPFSRRAATGLVGPLVLLSVVGGVLTGFTADYSVSSGGTVFVVALATGVVGVVVARNQPWNVIGWLMIALAVVLVLLEDAGLYSVLDYRHHGGRLPLGPLAVFLTDTIWLLALFLLPLPILFFPDGRLPSRRWRWVCWAYLVSMAAYMTSVFTAEAVTLADRPVRRVDPVQGGLDGTVHLTGLTAAVVHVMSVPVVVVLACWPLFIGRQVVAWQRASGERRQQLKWLMGGGAIAVVSALATVPLATSSLSGTVGNLAQAVTVLGLGTLPLGLGVAILKYRLYEIDRLISRTISYLILTGLLVGTFLGIVLAATRVLPFSSPVAVAASTVAAAALFNPLRRKIQHTVDRRFNRTRYNQETIVAGFRNQLRTASDLNTVRNSLKATVDGSVQPTHTTLWLRSTRKPDA